MKPDQNIKELLKALSETHHRTWDSIVSILVGFKDELTASFVRKGEGEDAKYFAELRMGNDTVIKFYRPFLTITQARSYADAFIEKLKKEEK